MTAEYEVIVVGSGAGGATLARELGKRGVSVLVVETGVREPKVGRFRDAVGYYDASKLLKTPRTSEEGVILWRTLMAGGSTVVSAGNAIRADERGLRELDIDLADEYAEAEVEMGVEPVDESLLSDASRRLRDAAADRGYAFEPMPKFVDQEQCRRCGHCTLGCMAEAKWTALDYLDEAVQYGVDVRYAAEVREVLVEDGVVVGVRGVDRDGTFEVRADTVVLAAGALATPRILQQSGIEAGDGLFVDLFVNVYGVTPEIVNQQAEPQMALLADAFHDEGFLLSPYLNVPREVRFIEAGVRGAVLPLPRTLGLMVKISDDASGRVLPNGTVSKRVTDADQEKLDAGVALATETLVAAGADESSVLVTKHQGAHPGGTAAIGRVVDADLRTEVDGLYVCDASVLPEPPGAPPILTIVALAKRLGASLATRTGADDGSVGDTDAPAS